MKREVEEKIKADEAFEEKRKKLLADNKLKQEEILRKNMEKKERMLKKKKLEERWDMTRWISEYIDQNTERWKTEKQQRMKTEAERAEDWKKMKRREDRDIEIAGTGKK